VSARFADLVYSRHIIRSDGAHWVDGERDDSADRSWLTVDGSQIVLAPGMYDELLAVPRLATDEEAQSWAELTGPIFDAEPFVRTISKVDEHGASLSVLAQKADEISSTVARVMPGGDIYTTIQQTAEDVAQRVVKKGEVVTEINVSEEGARIAGNKIMLDGDTLVTGPLTVTNESGGAVRVEDGALMFLADTLTTVNGQNITSAEARPVTTDSSGQMSVMYPVTISAAQGVRVYKGGLTVYSGADPSDSPDLIDRGRIQPGALTEVPSHKLRDEIPLALLPRVLRTAPGIGQPTVYWGTTYVPAESMVVVTFKTALPYSSYVMLAHPSLTYIVSRSATGFTINHTYNTSDSVYFWVLFCASGDVSEGECTYGCQGVCQDSCQDSCQSGCLHYCQESCQHGCQATCEQLCQTACLASCQTQPIQWR
jgi:hypothetical protein